MSKFSVMKLRSFLYSINPLPFDMPLDDDGAEARSIHPEARLLSLLSRRSRLGSNYKDAQNITSMDT